MCGIAGIISCERVPLGVIDTMNDAQAHRGRDGSGVALIDGRIMVTGSRANGLEIQAGNIALGHRRLAILDLSTAGSQPMTSRDGRFVTVYNGEIYNYRELRDELVRLGFSFRSGTDTEVMMAAYEAWGLEAFSRFNGMWAIVLIDREREQIVISRDRFGIKPLHYAEDGGRLVFASEIKALLPALSRSPSLNLSRAAMFLRHGLVNDSNETFFKGVAAFPPGHVAVAPLSRPTSFDTRAYWSLPAADLRGRVVMSPRECADRLRGILESAVSLRMRSDVPVGSCLSGGLDSSAVVMMASGARAADDPLFTFTAGFDDARLDERNYSNLVSAAAKANAQIVVPDDTTLMADWQALVRAQDEPFTSLSLYAQWSVMRLAREKGITVLLDGQGGDETMAGYRKYVLFHARQMLREGRYGALARFAAGLLRNGDRGLLRLAEGVRYLPSPLRRAGEGLARAVAADFQERWSNARFEMSGSGRVEDLQVGDLTRFSLPSLLRYEDRNSMAFGIEARLPFLDYRFAEFMLALAPEMKLRNGQTKAPLREAFRGVVPDAVLDRRDKLGFAPPQSRWLKGPFGRMMRDRFESDSFRLRKLVDPTQVAALMDGSGGFARAHESQAFRVYSLDAWAEAFDVSI